MTTALWHQIFEEGAVADLSDQVRLRLSGPDAVRYLNGQVTQDVRKLRPGLTLPACVTNHKGRLEAYLHLTADPDGSLLIAGPADLQDFLPLRLEKYLIADNCVLEEVTASTALIHVIAPLDALSRHMADGETASPIARFGPPGFDIWVAPARVPYWLASFPVPTSADLSELEVIHGIPAWGHELTNGLLPPEAGLDQTAIDYHKGCYIGQEVISRIRSVGRVNRRLASLVQMEGPPIKQGYVIHSSPADAAGEGSSRAAPSGHITRTAIHPLTGELYALAFLHRNTPDTSLPCGPEEGPATALLRVRKSLDD